MQYRKKVQRKRKSTENEENDHAEARSGKKPTRRTNIYGVDAFKAAGKKPSLEAIEAIAKTNSEDDFSIREATFTSYRRELQYHFRNSSKNISRISKGFLKSPEHVVNHFSWVSNSESLTPIVEANLVKQLENMEKVLKYKNRLDSQYMSKFIEIDEKCNIDYDGSPIYKYISILRMTADARDTDGSCFIRFDSEELAKTLSPHIVAVLVDRRFVFEIHAEGERLMGNLGLVMAISTLLHLAFIVDLHYPAECRTAWDIIQKNVAKYGCVEVTRASGGKGKAQKKYKDYLEDLGKAIAFF